MSAFDHLNNVQFASIQEIGRMQAGDFPGYTMNQVAHAPLKAHRDAGTVERYKRQDWRELADSMREHGVHEPLVIGSDKNGPAVWDGHHRFKAAKRAGLTHLPVVDEGGALDAAIEEYGRKRAQFNAGER